jgi:UDP-N-acetylmuramate dehydrogenase
MKVALADQGVSFCVEEPLARYTTIGLGGPAELMTYPASTEQMIAVLGSAAELELPVRVLGSGSNLLVSDEGVRGLVIHTGAMKVTRFTERGRVEAEAGVQFPGLVRAAVSRGLRGLEGGVGIPGSVGGVLAMNAGAYGFAMADYVDEVTVVVPGKGKLVLARDQVDFRYRSSSFGDDVVVARCRMQLSEDEPAAIREDMDARLAVRKNTQPVGVKSAGCIFKNPPGESAGKLIDELGLKGLRIGGARVSEVHANFFVHDGSASAGDVISLVEEVRERVFLATKVELEEEVKRWS